MNPSIYQWAIRWGVPLEGLTELQGIFRLEGGHELPKAITGTSEAAVAAAVRLEAASKGVKLFRNNVGALLDARGVPVRYGLANESKRINEKIKSGDYIGWRPVLITPAHVGQSIAQFVSRETKAVGWRYTGAGREPAQLAWAQLVTAGGGDATFCTGVGTL